MIKNIFFRLATALTIISLVSCEDPIKVDSGFEKAQVAIDAWINNDSNPQTIRVIESQGYFDNRLPIPITDAQVIVKNGDRTFEFKYQDNGNYTWTPEDGETIGSVGDDLTLSVIINDKSLNSMTSLNRVATIDSIKIMREENVPGANSELFAEMFASDHPGKGDTYWVRASRNDTLLNRPSEINVVYDATFDAGTDIDGTTFIRPLRLAINGTKEDGFPNPLSAGDKVSVEILSISQTAFDFLKNIQTQANNGGLFATPVSNSKGNIFYKDGKRALGIFNVAAVSRAEVTVPE